MEERWKKVKSFSLSLRDASIFCVKVVWKVVFCIRLKHVSDAVTHLKVEFLTSIMQKWERFESRGALRFTCPAQQEVTQHHLLLWRAELEGDPLLMTVGGGPRSPAPIYARLLLCPPLLFPLRCSGTGSFLIFGSLFLCFWWSRIKCVNLGHDLNIILKVRRHQQEQRLQLDTDILQQIKTLLLFISRFFKICSLSVELKSVVPVTMSLQVLRSELYWGDLTQNRRSAVEIEKQ